MNSALVERLRRLAEVKLDEPLSRHVTFGVGGPADVYLIVNTEDQLRLGYSLARKAGEPVFIYGSGSNVLVGDGGVRGVTVENRTAQVEGPSSNGAGFKARVASGVSLAALARRMSSAGYGGIGLPKERLHAWDHP